MEVKGNVFHSITAHNANLSRACFLIRITIKACEDDSLHAQPEKPMDESTSRRRGRPALSKTVPSDLGAEIWNRVQIYRIKERIRIGKAPSVARTCRALAACGGIQSIVGGNPGALAQANRRGNARWRRFQVDSSGSKLIPDVAGFLFSSHWIESAASLHARYSEANKLAKADPLVRLAWMNLARQMMGRPLKKPRWAKPWEPRAWRAKADGTFILATN
jgi:hypothetical protein